MYKRYTSHLICSVSLSFLLSTKNLLAAQAYISEDASQATAYRPVHLIADLKTEEIARVVDNNYSFPDLDRANSLQIAYQTLKRVIRTQEAELNDRNIEAYLNNVVWLTKTIAWNGLLPRGEEISEVYIAILDQINTALGNLEYTFRKREFRRQQSYLLAGKGRLLTKSVRLEIQKASNGSLPSNSDEWHLKDARGLRLAAYNFYRQAYELHGSKSNLAYMSELIIRYGLDFQDPDGQDISLEIAEQHLKDFSFTATRPDESMTARFLAQRLEEIAYQPAKRVRHEGHVPYASNSTVKGLVTNLREELNEKFFSRAKPEDGDGAAAAGVEDRHDGGERQEGHSSSDGLGYEASAMLVTTDTPPSGFMEDDNAVQDILGPLGSEETLESIKPGKRKRIIVDSDDEAEIVRDSDESESKLILHSESGDEQEEHINGSSWWRYTEDQARSMLEAWGTSGYYEGMIAAETQALIKKIAQQFGIEYKEYLRFLNKRGIKPHVKGLTTLQETQIISLLGQGMSHPKIAKEIGSTPSAVSHWSQKNGYSKPLEKKVESLNDVQKAQIRELFESDITYERICDHVHCTMKQLTKFLNAQGLKRYKESNVRLSEEQKSEIHELRRQGHSRAVIAERVKCSEGQVQELLTPRRRGTL